MGRACWYKHILRIGYEKISNIKGINSYRFPDLTVQGGSYEVIRNIQGNWQLPSSVSGRATGKMVTIEFVYATDSLTFKDRV